MTGSEQEELEEQFQELAEQTMIQIRDAFLLAFAIAIHRPRLACWYYGHDWADETKWGVEPVCLTCGAERRGYDG